MSEIIASLSAAIWSGTGWAMRLLPDAGGGDLHLYGLAMAGLLLGWRGAKSAPRD